MLLIIISDLYLGAREQSVRCQRSTRPLRIFSMVVLPVPLFPMRATRSPRLMSKEILENRVCPGKALDKPSTVSTSFPLMYLGSRGNPHLILDLQRAFRSAASYPAFFRGFRHV